ncbi:hypothetical protein B0H11DRAFT_2196065 [Mycena galericulata]|nr:hypothetical protein B0H11DRAFT_2196065 [Mycena galericulata]
MPKRKTRKKLGPDGDADYSTRRSAREKAATHRIASAKYYARTWFSLACCYIPSQKGKERPPGSPDVDASPEHPEEDRRFSCQLFSQHHSSEGYRKGCRVIRRMLEATGGKLVEADRLRWSPTQCNRLCGSSTRPRWDPSDRKRSGRRAWGPGLICDSAGDSEDARKGTGEAPDEVEGSRPETGKGLSQEPDDWSEE